MKILPLNSYKADAPNWIVRWLKYTGYLICTGTTITGISVAYNYCTNRYLSETYLFLMLCILGALVGVVAGLAISLPLWGMAMLLDDIHALRIYASGYFTAREKDEDEDEDEVDDDHDPYDDFDP